KSVHRSRVASRMVAITFDDGYIDNLTQASPILCELALPATFFVTTDRLEAHYEYWWDALERLLAPGPDLPPALELTVTEESLSLPTASAEECRSSQARIYRAIVDQPADVREATLSFLRGWSGRSVPVDLEHRRINGAEVAALGRRPGHDIGGH